MDNQEFVSFKAIYESSNVPGDLLKELKQVELTLNLTPTVKSNNQYVKSPTNVSVNQYTNLVVRKISAMVDQGLSYNNCDYYIFVQFGGKPTISKSPNGMMQALSKLASKAGLIANINTGCIYEGYKELLVTRDGAIDKFYLINNPESEIKQIREGDIIAPYAVITLINKSSGNVISRKVTIVRNNEYINAKKQGSYTHKSYPVPMAVKIALKRAAQEMMSSLGMSDEIEEMETVRSEINDHNKDYDTNKSLDAEPVIQDDVFEEQQNNNADNGIVDFDSI